MPSTHTSNVHKHPGRVIQVQKKWTTKQVAEDKAHKKAASIAARQKAAEKCNAVLLQLTESRSAVEQDEEEVHAHSTRPDIQSSSYQMPQAVAHGETEIDHCDDSSIEDAMDTEEEPSQVVDNSVYTEGWNDSLSKVVVPGIDCQQGPQNAKRGSLSLRQDVDATGMRNKRKLEEPLANMPVNVHPKHLKWSYTIATIPGGLSSNWKANVTTTFNYQERHGQSSQANSEFEGNSNGPVSEDFDGLDELEEALAQVKASKSTAPTWVSRGRTKPAVASVKSGHKKAMVADLPFPDRKNSRIWRKSFVPLLIAWAGSQLDPFGTNSKVREEAEVVWSNIGKAGNSTIAELWSQKAKEEDVSFSSLEHHAIYVTNSLQEMRFMYKNPDVPATIQGSRGASHLESVSKVYAKHLQRILAVGGKYGLQIGGLALVMVAVECGLTLLSDGEDGKANKDEEQGKPVPRGTRGNSFTDNPWGKRAHKVVQSAKRLTDYNWEQIEEHTTVYLQSLGHDSDEGCREGVEANATMSMRANIDID
ncbi:hypothetical protein H4582DRAFT_2065259 [Lactarius indigo]|nr:hypothetical protein H4582DRAFT_2065259 [Lactarius indigo]